MPVWKPKSVIVLPASVGLAAFIFCIAGIKAFCAGSGGLAFHGHMPKVVGKLTPVGSLAATNELQLAIGLPLRDEAGLDVLLKEIYDSASPNYHRYLTPAEFTTRFGPTEADYAAVQEFARTNGLKITGTHPGRVVLDVRATVKDLERIFHIKLRTYRHPREARDFYAPDIEPTTVFPAAVLQVSGLDNYSLPQPKSVTKSLISQVTPKNGSSSVGAYIGNDFRRAYVPNTQLTGAGQSVALLQFDGYASNDIVAYASAAGLSMVSLTNVLVNGGVSVPGTGEVEVCLDIEMVMSMAPGISQIIVYEGPNGGTAWSTILAKIAEDNLARQVSCSWGATSPGAPDLVSEGIFKQMAAQGQSFFNATGDNDAFVGGIPFPSESTNITQVGGTTLTMNGSGISYVSETVWNWNNSGNPGIGSGGGISANFGLPPWQQGLSTAVNQGSTTLHNVPDVALTADNVYVVHGGSGVGSGGHGGTSCAAPLWAGFMALVNEQAETAARTSVGFINPAVYAIGTGTNYQNCFHDVVTGNNFWSSSPTNFPAVAGYDLCTGWGTPNGQNLMNALGGLPEPLGVWPDVFMQSASGFTGGPFSSSTQTVTLTNLSSAPLSWTISNPSAWLSVSASNGTIAVAGQTSVTISMNSTANSFPAGNYSASILFSNLTSGIQQSRQFNLKIMDPLLLLINAGSTIFGPAGGPFIPATQNLTFTNLSPSLLNWSLLNTSAWLSVSASNGSISGNSSVSVTVSTNAATAALANGIYNSTLILSNQNSHVVQSANFSARIGQPLVQNSGFETGDFTSWTLNGSGNNANYVDSSGNFVAPHTGTYCALLGESGALAYLSQTLPTVSGQKYLLSLWMNNPVKGKISGPDEFSVSWNGSTLYDTANFIQASWLNLQFVVTATGASTVLQIGGRDDPSYIGLDDVSVTPVFAPTFSTQPTNLTVLSGDSVVFSATVGGTTNLVYQWRKGGTNLANGAGIAGATTTNLSLTAVTTNSTGNYTLYVTNAYGSITSSIATLTVVLPVAIASSTVTNRTVECGKNTNTFTITASGTAPLSIRWSTNGVPIVGATNASFALTNLHPATVTNVAVTVTNLYGTATTNAVITVFDSLAPVITLIGSNPLYHELGSTFTDPGATANDTCAGAVTVVSSGVVNPNSLGTNTLTYIATDGSNSATNTRSVIVRDTTSPTIVWSFTNVVFAADTNCSARMPDVTGTNFIIATDASGALTLSQSPTNNFLLPLGTNTVVITIADASGNPAYSTNTVIVLDQMPPVFLSQPSSQTNFIGTSVTFSTAATACTPLTYQWYSNTIPTLATNPTLTLSNLTPAAAGNYFVVASANGGASTSLVATLTVQLIPPGINGTTANLDGSFSLNLTGSPGYPYILEATTNLFSGADWLPLATNYLGTNGVWNFTDTAATNFPQQFYRLRLAP